MSGGWYAFAALAALVLAIECARSQRVAWALWRARNRVERWLHNLR